ncbi:TetR family transcriptional regulator [Mesorhizobium hungaricum]|uniref:TetR family transcriptional regulator n=2 Tax=Phyllobacteriaceae TaxID=69277 RepID=A0A1C2DN02_9HYPH|nr:TetR/AcrR family transcriptional regulator [Mesorhizobium sp.]OCX16140.1 TetR family transcriptional regulator [Mesorhizobium hungaricum]
MQPRSSRRSNSERSAEMRARLIATARRLFVAHGYAATSTPAIVEEAGVTRGALYHHFPDKQAIFQAVIDAESAHVAEAIEAVDAPAMTALERLLAGADAYVRTMQVGGRTRLLLVDGPAVLGREAMRQIEGQHGDANLKIGLEEAMAEGSLPRLPIEPLASLLSAMFERAALDVADGTAPADVLTALRQILTGLTASDQGSAGQNNARIDG